MKFVLTGHHYGHLAGVDDQQHRSIHVDIISKHCCGHCAHIRVQVAKYTADHCMGYQTTEEDFLCNKKERFYH